MMTPDSLYFQGDTVTVLGLVGVISTGIILVLCFTRYFNSPLSQMSYYNPNVYEEYILSKGRDLPTRTAAPKAQYPRTIGLRVFETEEEYEDAMADFLNGM